MLGEQPVAAAAKLGHRVRALAGALEVELGDAGSEVGEFERFARAAAAHRATLPSRMG